MRLLFTIVCALLLSACATGDVGGISTLGGQIAVVGESGVPLDVRRDGAFVVRVQDDWGSSDETIAVDARGAWSARLPASATLTPLAGRLGGRWMYGSGQATAKSSVELTFVAPDDVVLHAFDAMTGSPLDIDLRVTLANGSYVASGPSPLSLTTQHLGLDARVRYSIAAPSFTPFTAIIDHREGGPRRVELRRR